MAIEIQTTKQQIEDFNRKHIVSMTIAYKDESGVTIVAKIRFPAEELEGVGPVVWVSGRVGCVKLDNVILHKASDLNEDEDLCLSEIG